LFPDFLVLGEAASLELREDLFAIDANFKTAAIGGNEDQSLDFVF